MWTGQNLVNICKEQENQVNYYVLYVLYYTDWYGLMSRETQDGSIQYLYCAETSIN